MMGDASTVPEDSGQPDQPLEIPADLHEALIAHCRRENPLECCGILGGVARRALSIHPLRNLAASETRFEADPTDLVQAWRCLREREHEILAIYHSHPRWEAIPSAIDREKNYWGCMPQIIVSLLADPPVVRAWRLSENSQQELSWSLVEPSS